jgi:hypothetical protein
MAMVSGGGGGGGAVKKKKRFIVHNIFYIRSIFRPVEWATKTSQ